MPEKFFALPTFLGDRHNGMVLRKSDSDNSRAKDANVDKVEEEKTDGDTKAP